MENGLREVYCSDCVHLTIVKQEHSKKEQEQDVCATNAHTIYGYICDAREGIKPSIFNRNLNCPYFRYKDPTYCSECKWFKKIFFRYSCTSPENKYIAPGEKWLSNKKAHRRLPEDLNRSNNCKLFEKKYR